MICLVFVVGHPRLEVTYVTETSLRPVSVHINIYTHHLI